MITLPPTLEVSRDVVAERELYEKARAWLTADERAPGIHASDLLMPRKGYFRAVDPQPYTDRQVGLYMVGRVLHAFILGSPDLAADEGSKHNEDLGLYYSPDKIRDGVPVEVKTSRSWKEPTTFADLDIYLEQLLTYMAIERSVEGKLWVLYLNAKDANNRTAPTFRVYNVTLSADELEAVRLQVRTLTNDLSFALARKDFSALPLCPEWACGPTECPWWRICQPPGRYENEVWVKRRSR